MAEATGVNVVFFESKTDDGGKYLGVNGAHRDGTIYLDVNAGKNNVDIGETAILKTMSHELTHFIQQNSGQYEALKEFVANHVLESVDSIERLAQQKIDNDSTGELTMDGAMDEVVADACEMMLRNTEAVQRLANENRSLAEKIRDWIGDFVKKLRAAFKGDRATHDEARAMLDRMVELQKLWDDALVDAAKTKAGNGKTDFDHAGQVTNADGEMVAASNGEGGAVFSLRTYDEDGREYLNKWLERAEKRKRITREDADDIRNQLDYIYRICREYEGKYAPFGAWSNAAVVYGANGKPLFSVVKQNGEYAMNLDFSLVCKKRRTLDAVLNELVRRGVANNMDLGGENLVRVNDIIREYGFETACKMCFVDAKRFRQADVSDTFADLYNDLVRSLAPSGSGAQIDYFNYGGDRTKKSSGAGIDTLADSELDFSNVDEVLRTYGKLTSEYKAAKYIRENAGARKLVQRSDFLASDGFSAVKQENPELLKIYNSKKGSAGPKAAFGDVQYLNDILRKGNWSVKKAYAVGGVRAQSFSDYVPRMVFDYMQMAAELSAKKLPAHAYTKEALFVKQFGLTGMKINMSLMPAMVEGGIAPGLDANGNYVWADESFDYKTAVELQNAEGYRNNCGTICVGISDAHIRKLMSDPNIRMVIPYHKSGINPVVAHMMRIGEYPDYTGYQNTRYADGVKLSKEDAKHEPNFNQILHDMGANGDPRAAAQKYLDWCEEHGYLPKFDQFAYKYVNGERVTDENYYKLLEDFTTLVDGEYHAQEAVKMVFPDENSAFGSIAELIREGLEEDAIVEGMRTERVGEICDRIEREIGNTGTAKENSAWDGGTQFSERDYSYEILTSKPDMRVTNVDDRVPYRPTREARKEIVARAIANAKKIGRTNENGNAVVRVADTGDEVILSAKGLRHGLDRRLNENAPVTLMAGEILHNSIRINELTPQHPDADGSYVLLGVGKTEQGTLYLVRSVVNKYSNALSSMDVLYAVSAKKENRLRSMRPEFQHSVTDSTISVRSLLDYVNRYFPDVLPESVLRHYNHDRRPEGELGESALYQRRDDTRTDRDVLSDAADGDAINVREMEMLREYREKLQKYSSLTRRLERQRELAQNAESKEERLKAKNRADNLAAQVSRADEQLTRMQNAKPLRELVAREMKTRDSLEKENAMLRDRVEYWRGQTQRTKEATTDPKAVREAARAIIEQTSSNLDVDEVAGRLQELYDGIARGDEVSYSEIRTQAEQLAGDIVSDATAVDDTMYREYSRAY